MNAFANPVVVLKTTQGDIHLQLFPDIAPKACENFLKLIEKGYYTETVFHRVIPDFMIQGGDPTSIGMGGNSIWNKPFEDEVTDSAQFDKPGRLAMANKGPNTNGSQFFITTNKTPWLNMRHTIFGEVVHGMDIVNKIGSVKTDPRDRPVQEQKILEVTILEENTP